ncbi:MAG: YraN family protein [Flavipsychrobacter sp.]|nr:YraN family protein [Flavipsychrobacter sp.]
MAKHNETGLKGEQIAENFLLNKGYQILHRNWRSARKEIDLIALRENLLVFVEVKTRKNFYYGFPEEFVDVKKQALMKEAAEAFVTEHPQYMEIRFDIISIQLEKGQVKDLTHFEEAFY